MPLPIIAAVAARVLAPAIGRMVAGAAIRAGATEGGAALAGNAARTMSPTIAKGVTKSLTGGDDGGAGAAAQPSAGGFLSQMNNASANRVGQRASELRPY